MEDAIVDVPIEQKKSVGRRRALLSNRFSTALLAVYIFLAIGIIISLWVDSTLGATAGMMIAGALILIVQLDIRIRVADSHTLIRKELQAIRGQSTATHNFLVRVESRAKFRYHRLSGTLAGQSTAVEALTERADQSTKLERVQVESLKKVHSESARLRAELAEMGDFLAKAPEPVTEEMLKKRFGANSSRLTKWFEDVLEAQASSAEMQRESEVEDIRNVILSSLAIQRAELNILASRLLDDAPRV